MNCYYYPAFPVLAVTMINHGNQVQDGPKKSVFDFAVYLGLYDGIHWGGCKVSSILCTVECLLIQCHVPASFAYF